MTEEQIDKLLALLPELEKFLKSQKKEKEEIPAPPEKKNKIDGDHPFLSHQAWPAAVPPELICDKASEKDKFTRAENILGIMPFDVKGKKFLDFGCGEGHLAVKAKESASLSIGYDIVQRGTLSWEETLTTDLGKVSSLGPYDFVALYDVLDHADDPVKILEEVKSVSDDGTKIYVRCHPWCCRHGGHAYHRWNKAFVHLILEEEELKKYDDIDLPKQKVIHPKITYEGWFSQAGLRIERKYEETQPVEPCFKAMPFRNFIVKHWFDSPDEDIASGKKFPDYPMSQNYQNYVLTK